MNYTLLGFYSNIFGFVMGGVTILGFIMCRNHLPSHKIKALETVLRETENDLKEVVEEGLLGHEFAQVAERRLATLRAHTRELRSRAHAVTTLRHDYAEFLRGTSSAIGTAYKSLRMLRAEIITSSEERRRGLIEIGSFISSIPATPPFLASDSEINNLSPTTEIHQPNSHPSIATESEPTDQDNEADNPFDETTRTGLNVRTTDGQT